MSITFSPIETVENNLHAQDHRIAVHEYISSRIAASKGAMSVKDIPASGAGRPSGTGAYSHFVLEAVDLVKVNPNLAWSTGEFTLAEIKVISQGLRLANKRLGSPLRIVQRSSKGKATVYLISRDAVI